MSAAAATLILDAKDVVGESIVWSAAERALYWVDIVGSRIHRLEPQILRHHTWPTPELPTSIGQREGGGFIVGLRRRVCLWQPDGCFETFAVPEPDLPGNRLNEGVVAPDGTFWVGTMQDNIGPDLGPMDMMGNTGALYRIAPDGGVARLSEDSFGITNTMVWLNDGTFITADTLRNELYAYRYDRPAHRLLDRRVLARIEGGLPDGSTRDAKGHIYNARVAGGASIACLGPDGELLSRIMLPCTSPTSCTFGSEDLSTLFVTSSRFGMTAAELASNPAEGGLFAIEGLSKGLPANLFARSASAT